MAVLTASAARANLYRLIDQAADWHDRCGANLRGDGSRSPGTGVRHAGGGEVVAVIVGSGPCSDPFRTRDQPLIMVLRAA